MATSSTLHDLRIPAEWRALCQILISDVLVSSRCFGTLAEIFDGYQTTETLMETNDYMSLIENSGQEKSSEAAIRDAKSWTCELDVGKIELDHFWSGELVKLFSKSDKDTERFVGVALCVFKPVIRWCFEHYCKRLLERGKSIPNFGWWLSSSSNVERMQDWGEARIFGGLLAISKHQLLVTPPGQVRGFSVEPATLLGISKGTLKLPFVRPYSTKRYPRLEDDRDLFNEVNRRCD